MGGDNLAISKSQQLAVKKYNAKAYEEIKVRVYTGKKSKVRAHAEQQGESLNGFINRAIDETMERDRE